MGLYLLRIWIKGGVCKSKARMDGKTVVITGCNTGLGKETALDLARRGARVIMACRNLDLANKAADDIREKTQGNVVVYRLDLADLTSVRECADKVNKLESRVDVLINNAGIMWCPEMRTKEGFEMQIGTNHFGHFLFTNLLLDKIKASAPARIVTVSSMGHQPGYIDLDDINFEKRSYDSYQAYFQSKLANILFTRELARRVQGTGINCYSLHPGAVMTELSRYFEQKIGPLRYILLPIAPYFLKNPTDGAQTSIFCAVDESVANETGKYYSDCKEKTPSKRAQDDEVAKKLWDLSAKLVKLDEN